MKYNKKSRLLDYGISSDENEGNDIYDHIQAKRERENYIDNKMNGDEIFDPIRLTIY